MKKKIGVVFLILVLILEFSIVVKLYNTNIQSKSRGEIYDVMNSVSYLNLDNFIHKEDSSYVYIGRANCSDCLSFEPSFIEYLKKENINSQIYYLNIEMIHDNDVEWSKFQDKYDIRYTPTIAKFQNGQLISKVEWTPQDGISINKVSKWVDEYLN